MPESEFATNCMKFIEDTSKKPKDSPASAQDISALAALMLSMFNSLAPLRESVAQIPVIVNDIKVIKDDILELKDVVRSVVKNCNSMARHSYDYNVLVHALPEAEEESNDQLRKSVLSVLSNCSAKPRTSDIEVVHRLGKPKPDKSRPVVVKFFNRNIKRRVVTEFNARVNDSKKSAVNEEAASKIRSQVTNHYPWRKMLDVDSLFSIFDEEAAKKRRTTEGEAVSPKRKIPKGGRGRWWLRGSQKNNIEANNEANTDD